MTRTPLALALASLAACTTPATPPAATTERAAAPAPRVVDPATALSLAAAGARLVDVRTPQEFAAGHLPGAVNVPHDQIASRAGELGPPGAPVVVYCRSGHRSGISAETLRALGYSQVFDAQRYDRLAAAAGR